MKVEHLHAAARDETQLGRLLGQGWPAFIGADAEAARYLPAVRKRFADLELLVVDRGRYVAAGWAVPVLWNGEVSDLPGGYSDTLRRCLEGDEAGSTANTLVVCAAQVDESRRGSGIAVELLTAFRDAAASRGYLHLIVPLRPTLKQQYPLTPIADYASWSRPDGSPFDPWLRTHWRMGARVVATAPQSQTMTAAAGDWERWTGLALPAPGDYIIPGGLSPLRIDDAGWGTYIEPNIWVEHPLGRSDVPLNGHSVPR